MKTLCRWCGSGQVEDGGVTTQTEEVELNGNDYYVSKP
jgi:hypothetical protein